MEKVINNKYIALVIILKDLLELAADAKGYLSTGVFAANHFDWFEFLLHLFVAGWIYLLIDRLNKQKIEIDNQQAEIAKQKGEVIIMLDKMKVHDVIFRYTRKKDSTPSNINFSQKIDLLDDFTDEEKEVLAKHGYISKDYKR